MSEMLETIVFLDRATVPTHIQIRPPHFKHQWTEYDLTAPKQVIERAKDASIIITNKVVISAEILAQLPQLKHIALIATGYNNIDIDACQQRGVGVSNTRGYANVSVPEHTLALIFSLQRHIQEYHHSVQQGQWQTSSFFHHYLKPTQDLASSRLGIIGSGELGQGTARLAKAIGMDVVFAERKQNTGTCQEKCREGFTPFDEVIQTCDIISLHCPLNEDTQNLIALPEMQAMKSTAFLINTARGGLINESDLVTAIKGNIIAGVGLDVVIEEPIKDDNPLLTITNQPNVIITPHIAWTSDQAMTIQAEQLISNIECHHRGDQQNRVV